MWKVITVRHKGGATDGEKAQERALAEQEKIQEQLSAIDKEYYDLRRGNKAQYDETFRPLEEDLLRRAVGPAREATSAQARASEYGAATEATRESTERREGRYGITGAGDTPDAEDDYIRAIALTAVGNAGKESALETGNMLKQAGLGMGSDINQDIGQSFGRSIQGISEGLGHADAAFSNYANQQTHLNNAYLSRQQGTGALINAGVSVAGMGISNYQTAQRTAALGNNSTNLPWTAALTGSP
jgi:hypothetical protein